MVREQKGAKKMRGRKPGKKVVKTRILSVLLRRFYAFNDIGIGSALVRFWHSMIHAFGIA
jgi:hypothetical protein